MAAKNTSKGKTGMTIDELARKMNVPTPYLRLKIGRYGKDQKAILASIRRDIGAIAKIAKDLEIDKGEAQKRFFEQLLSYRDQFDNWNAPVTPEDLVIGGFKKLLSKQLCIEKPVLALVLDVGEPRKSSRNSTFRWINLLVENDIAGEPWKMVRVIHWGQLSSGITSGSSVFVTIEDQSGFNTLTNISKSSRALPDEIPGDPRRRVMNLASSLTLTSRAKQEGRDDVSYVFVTLLAETEHGSEIIQGTSVKTDRWQNAPHGVALDTLILEKSDSGNKRSYVQDWQISQNQEAIPMPSDIPVIFDLSPESLAMYLDEWVILDGLAITVTEKEGANGNFDVIGLQSFETESSVIVRHNAWIQEGLIEERVGMRYFTVPRIRVLTFLSTYEVNGKTRLSRNAVAVWGYSPDDEPEEEGDFEEIDLSTFGSLEVSDVIDVEGEDLDVLDAEDEETEEDEERREALANADEDADEVASDLQEAEETAEEVEEEAPEEVEEVAEEEEETTEEAEEETAEEGDDFEGLEEVEITDEVEAAPKKEAPRKRMSVKEYAAAKAKERGKEAPKKEAPKKRGGDDKVDPPVTNMTPNAKKTEEAPEEELDNLGRPYPKIENKLPKFITGGDKKGGEAKPKSGKGAGPATGKGVSPEELKRVRELKAQQAGKGKGGAANPLLL